MQFLVRVEKTARPTVSDVCAAAGIATVTLLAEAEERGWQPEVDRWLAGRMRKIVRRARGSAWAKTDDLAHTTITRGSAEVRAFVPGPTDAVPVELSKLQVEGLVLDHPDAADGEVLTAGTVIVSMNPRWQLDWHPGKAAAQAAHAVQLASKQMDSPIYESWRAQGFPVHIDWPDRAVWERLQESAEVVVTDAGFTVVEPGARTCAATWR